MISSPDSLSPRLPRHLLRGRAVHRAAPRVASLAEAPLVAGTEIRWALHGEGRPGRRSGRQKEPQSNQHPTAEPTTAGLMAGHGEKNCDEKICGKQNENHFFVGV